MIKSINPLHITRSCRPGSDLGRPHRARTRYLPNLKRKKPALLSLLKNFVFVDGDKIVVDAVNRSIDWHVSAEEEASRRKAWEGRGKNKLKVKRGVLLRYARDVAVSETVASFTKTCANLYLCPLL